jgi:hypothetical protein
MDIKQSDLGSGFCNKYSGGAVFPPYVDSAGESEGKP